MAVEEQANRYGHVVAAKIKGLDLPGRSLQEVKREALGGLPSDTGQPAQLGDDSFQAVFQQEAGGFRPGDVISGRYLVEEGLVATACELLR